MKFRGSYEVSRTLKGQDIESTRTAMLTNVNVGGNITVSPLKNVNFGANPLNNVGQPIALTDGATKRYVDDSVRHIHVGVDVPSVTLGDNEDLYFRGSLGGLRKLPLIASSTTTDIASDGNTIIVTANTASGQYYQSRDNGMSWLVRTGIPDNTIFYRFVASTEENKFVIFRTNIGSGIAPPIYSLNGGDTWQASTVPAFTSRVISTVIVDKDNANPRVIVLTRGGKSLYSNDAGKTFALSNLPDGEYRYGAMFGTVVVVFNAAGTTYRSTDGGVTYTVQGTLPAISLLYTSIIAIDSNIMIAAGTGTDSNKMAITYNAGTTWQVQQVSNSLLNVTDMIINRITGAIVSMGSTGIAAYTKVDSFTTWTNASIDDTTFRAGDVGVHGAGFIASSNASEPIVAVAHTSSVWSVNAPPLFSSVYSKLTNKWVELDAMSQRDADSRYLQASGGIVNGTLGMNNHRITGVLEPINDQDVATKKYVKSQLDIYSGIFIDATIGTINTVIDTVPGTTESLKYVVSAKAGTGRYYSEINVLANGTDVPVSSEYTVLSLGGLDIDITFTKDTLGNTVLTAKSSIANTTFRVKRIEVDI